MLIIGVIKKEWDANNCKRIGGRMAQTILSLHRGAQGRRGYACTSWLVMAATQESDQTFSAVSIMSIMV